MESTHEPGRGTTRRDFLKGAAVGTLAGGLLEASRSESAPATPDSTPSSGLLKGPQTLRLKINGAEQQVVAEPRTTLLDALRDGHHPDGQAVALTGAKRVCDRGSCGACTVHLDGRAVYACTVLAVDCVGHEIRTVEGLAHGDTLHVVQSEFIAHDALMCGFCTPGFVMAAAALLQKNKQPSREQILAGLAGNLCRCGTYNRVVEAVEAAAHKLA